MKHSSHVSIQTSFHLSNISSGKWRRPNEKNDSNVRRVRKQLNKKIREQFGTGCGFLFSPLERGLSLETLMSWKLHVRLLCINKMQLNLVQKCTMRCDKRQYYRSAKHHVLLKKEDLMYIKLSHALHKWNTVVSYTPNAYHLLIGDRRRLLKE